MKVLFVEYPKCSTCKKAGKWLQEHGVGYDDRHIVEQNPTAEELKEWHEKSGLPLKRFLIPVDRFTAIMELRISYQE